MKHVGNIAKSSGSTRTKKRVGRGPGSGMAKTSTRGHKGHSSRSGHKEKRGFEGGQMPLYRRIPKFGFTNPFRVEYQIVNVDQLQVLVDTERLSDGIVTPEVLYSLGVIRKRNEPVKILGEGELSATLTVTAHKVSQSAKTKIESVGGTVTSNE